MKNRKQLMRTWVKTDDSYKPFGDGSKAVGLFTDDPIFLDDDWEIVSVDWNSRPGEVEVTYLLPWVYETD